MQLQPDDWRGRAHAHHARGHELLGGHRYPSSRGIKHPVEDFLFDYYSYRPYQLRRWHPGVGVELIGGQDEYANVRGYRRTPAGVEVDVARLRDERSRLLDHIERLVRATLERPPRYGCFGMHEWAMVYGLQPDQTRHSYLPLRCAPDEIVRIVDERGVACSHFDAFRFFTPEARPLNAYRPTRDTQVELEQPGCLHAGMDVYKWAYKLAPLTSSALVLDAFVLARDIRALDMAASAYDVAAYGYPPVPVETAEGRADYVRAQRSFSERAQRLRRRLLDEVAATTGVAS